jgi:hypothetical protein
MPAFFEWEMRLVWLRFQASPALSLRLMAVLFLCRPADENCSCSQPERERERGGGGDREERENLYGFVFSDWWPWCSGSERGRPLVWVWGVQLQPQPLPRAEALSLPGLTKTHHRRRALVSMRTHPTQPLTVCSRFPSLYPPSNHTDHLPALAIYY